jgi:shikimate dehydrogenase
MLAVDLIYLPPMTEFVRFARKAGATALDGLGMLVHQAALSFRLWTGIYPPVDVMAEAAHTALSSDEASDPA